MKIISHELGKVSRAYVPDEIRPTTGIYLPELIRLTGERYAFSVLPSVPDVQKGGATFQQGLLITGGKKIPIPSISIYSDAVSANAFDTDTAEFILEDVITWAWTTFNLREPITKPTAIFESQVVVEFPATISRVVRFFEGLKQLTENA